MAAKKGSPIPIFFTAEIAKIAKAGKENLFSALSVSSAVKSLETRVFTADKYG
jgi:hypothetical protein